MKTPGRIFVHQAEVRQLKRLRHPPGEMGSGRLGDGGMFCRGQRSRQGQMKAEFFHHIGVAVNRQQIALARRQAIRVAAGSFGFGQGSAVGVQHPHHLGGQTGQAGGIAVGHEGQKAFEIDHLQTRQRNGPILPGKCLHRGCQIARTDPSGQPERRLDRAVKAVAARRGGQIGHGSRQTGNRGLDGNLPDLRVPPQPGRRRIGKAARWRRVEDRVAFHFIHPVSRLWLTAQCHAPVTVSCHHNSSQPESRANV